jgi:hypothetical protein
MPTQTHLITFAEAADYISSFLNKPSGKQFSNDFGIGSLFPLPAIPNHPPTALTKGTFFYPCCNGAQPNELVFGYVDNVSLSNSDDYSSYNPANFGTLETSAVTLQYTSIGTSSADVSDFLTKMDLSTYLTGGLFPMPNHVVADNQNFRTFFARDVDSVSYGAGFFENPAVYDMWTQEGAVTFCAFLGLDDSLTYDKVRIVLIGVDSNGKLILTTNGQNVAVLLDKSWPRK